MMLSPPPPAGEGEIPPPQRNLGAGLHQQEGFGRVLAREQFRGNARHRLAAQLLGVGAGGGHALYHAPAPVHPLRKPSAR